MIIEEIITNNSYQKDLNLCYREMNIDMVYGKIIDSYLSKNKEDKILKIQSDEYGRYGYYKTDILHIDGNLSGSRGRFHLIIDKFKIKEKFKNGLYTVYNNGDIINNIIDDPNKNVFKKELFKHNSTIYIKEIKYDNISISDIILLTNEYMILKNNDIIQYKKCSENIVFNVIDCIEYKKDQTFHTLPKIYIPESIFIKISKIIENRNNNKIPYFKSKEFIKYDNFILMVPNKHDIDNYPSISYVIQNGHIIPIAIGMARMMYDKYESKLLENIEKDLKEKIKRMDIHPNIKILNLSDKEKELIRQKINDIYKIVIDDILDQVEDCRFCDGKYHVVFYI